MAKTSKDWITEMDEIGDEYGLDDRSILEELMIVIGARGLGNAALAQVRKGIAEQEREPIIPRAKLDEPWVSNYPPLDQWLKRVGARCVHQMPVGYKERPEAYIEMWEARGRMFSLFVFAGRRGWDVFSGITTNDIRETLEDLEQRLGITTVEPPIDPKVRTEIPKVTDNNTPLSDEQQDTAIVAAKLRIAFDKAPTPTFEGCKVRGLCVLFCFRAYGQDAVYIAKVTGWTKTRIHFQTGPDHTYSLQASDIKKRIRVMP